MAPYKNLLFVLLLTEILGILSTVLLTYWIYSCLGFGWEDDLEKMHSWNILVMPVVVFLMGNGIIIYRVLRQFKTSSVKWLHFLIHTITLAAIAFGIMVVLKTREVSTIKDQSSKSLLFSLHSWLGIMFLIIFSLQYVCGVFFFICKCCNEKKSEVYAVAHAFFGIFAIITAAVTAILGVSQKAEWIKNEYDEFVLPTVIVNSSEITLLLYVGCIIYIAVNPFFEWDRPMTPTSSMNE